MRRRNWSGNQVKAARPSPSSRWLPNRQRQAVAMITGIDHIAIQVRDFDATVAGYEAIFGRVPNWRGFSPGGCHAWFQFAGTALDVIGATGTGPQADAARAE